MFKTFFSLLIWPIWFVFFVPSLIILLFLIIIIPREKLYYFIRPFSWLSCFFCGQWLKKVNKLSLNNEGPYIYMFNHVSMFDQFMIGAYIPHYITAVAAIEIFRYPIWGFIIKKYGVIPIVRQKIKKAIGSLNLAEDAIMKGVSFLISPEGTRTLTGQIGPFKKGPFHLAKNTRATIIPIGLIGGFKAKKKSDWRVCPGILRIKFGQPIKGDQFKNMEIKELQNLVFNRISRLVNGGEGI